MTVPVTGVVPGPVSVKVVGVNVRESIPSLNVAVIFPLIGTPVAAFAGTVEVTVGAVVSAVRQDSKLHEKLLASGLPLVSLAEVVIVAVYMLSRPRLVVGVKIAMLFVASNATVPVTGLVPVTRKVAVLIVVTFPCDRAHKTQLDRHLWAGPPAPTVHWRSHLFACVSVSPSYADQMFERAPVLNHQG